MSGLNKKLEFKITTFDLLEKHMKVCMVGVFNYYSDGRVKGYAESLNRIGVAVDVLALHGYAKNQSAEHSGIRVFNIPIQRIRKNLLTYSLEYGFAFLLFSFLLTRMFLKERYDIIHVHNMPDFLVFTGLIPKLFGAKLILDIHDPMPEVYISKFPNAPNGIGVRLMRLQEKYSTILANAVITANSNFRKNLISRGIPASKITVINNYPNPRIFNSAFRSTKRANSNEPFTLIFPGTIAPRYGLDVAIRAMPFIKDKIQNVKLLIVGKQDEYVKSLALLAEQHGVASVVEFRAPVPTEEIPGLLLQADVGVYPALPDPHMSIATPTKVLEFAVVGIPILSSRLDIVEEMFGDTAALFFEPGNIEQFAECVFKLYESPELRASLVDNADRIYVQKHSWEQEFRAYLIVLDSLLPGILETTD